MISEIDKGTFGAVYRCQHTTTGQLFAAKYYSLKWLRSPDGVLMYEGEISAMSLLKHRNTISLKKIVCANDGILLVMDLVDGRTLLDILPRKRGVMEPYARQIFAQFLDGLEDLHRRRVVHRDIKMENVMIDRDGTVKIIDYGLSEHIPRKRRRSGALTVNMECGSLNYAAPEILVSCGRHYRGDLSDIWAAGILLYVLVNGRFPFDHVNEEKLREIIHASPDYIEGALNRGNMSPELKDLLRKVLVKRPNERASIAEMRAHPWVQGTKFPKPQCPEKTLQNKSGKRSTSFHNVGSKRSFTVATRFGREGLIKLRAQRGSWDRTVPPGYRYGAEGGLDDNSASSSTMIVARIPRKRAFSRMLGRVFKSSRRKETDPN